MTTRQATLTDESNTTAVFTNDRAGMDDFHSYVLNCDFTSNPAMKEQARRGIDKLLFYVMGNGCTARQFIENLFNEFFYSNQPGMKWNRFINLLIKPDLQPDDFNNLEII